MANAGVGSRRTLMPNEVFGVAVVPPDDERGGNALDTGLVAMP
jgi:hypothetical protein